MSQTGYWADLKKVCDSPYVWFTSDVIPIQITWPVDIHEQRSWGGGRCDQGEDTAFIYLVRVLWYSVAVM